MEFCSKTGRIYNENICQNYVTTHYELLLEILGSPQFNPDYTCQMLGACPLDRNVTLNWVPSFPKPKPARSHTKKQKRTSKDTIFVAHISDWHVDFDYRVRRVLTRVSFCLITIHFSHTGRL